MVDTCVGGETVFPLITPFHQSGLVAIEDACSDRGTDLNGIMVLPRRGTGLLFQHWDPNEKGDLKLFNEKSWHCSCPVGKVNGRDKANDSNIFGRPSCDSDNESIDEKWVTQYWVRERPWNLWRDDAIVASWNFFDSPGEAESRR